MFDYNLEREVAVDTYTLGQVTRSFFLFHTMFSTLSKTEIATYGKFDMSSADFQFGLVPNYVTSERVKLTDKGMNFADFTSA